MAIYAPGRRNRHNRPINSNKRSAIVMLSLTAMVDMFTVLAVFLLQNYDSTGAVIELDSKVELPQASAVKELQPAHVIVISREGVYLDKDIAANFDAVQAQQDWLIPGLQTLLQMRFKEEEEKRLLGINRLRDVVNQANTGAQPKAEDFRKITVQADRSIDFLTIKKVMHTIAEAGASQISFAVMKNEEKKK